jgi:membrane protease YdiL (CAAX protease family)
MMHKNFGKIPNMWTMLDVFGVVVCVIILSIPLFLLTLPMADERMAIRLVRYGLSIIFILMPIIWLRFRRKIDADALGLKKNMHSLRALILIGCTTALLLSLILRFSPFWHQFSTEIMPSKILHLILFPISVSGFALVVLVPTGEEIMFRGFLYGYIRSKMGIFLGLILQATIFSIAHLNYPFEGILAHLFSFIVGLTLGILYEKTGSLYASIICHGTYNYLLVTLNFIN